MIRMLNGRIIARDDKVTYQGLTRQCLRPMKHELEIKFGLTRRHEDTKKFRTHNSRFKLFFVGSVALCENWV
jgi:hypothetical protein